MLHYGKAPVNLGLVELQDMGNKGNAMMHYQYLPIFIRDDLERWKIAGMSVPPEMQEFIPLILKSAEHVVEIDVMFNYVYITVKRKWVEPDAPGNRPGWHADGFGSRGDLNFVWADMNPTEFAVQKFENISHVDEKMLSDINDQIDETKIVTYPDKTLLCLDESVIHRVGLKVDAGYRTFVKITYSKHKFDKIGNAHNFMIDYDWNMKPRDQGRNLDSSTHVSML